MSRILTLVLFLLLIGLGAAMLLWHLSYDPPVAFPESVELEALQTPVALHWLPDSLFVVDARDEREALVGLGFAHGLLRPWHLVYARQIALGRLGHWFGTEALTVDSMALWLGLASRARATYAKLSPSIRMALDAYAEGINAALDTEAARNNRQLVLLRLTPDRWEPWHTLALERLYAWLGVPPLARNAPSATAPLVKAFLRADRYLRSWLQLSGFEHGITWSFTDSIGTHLVQRHVVGATARPLFVEGRLQINGQLFVSGASLPGTPFFPAGRSVWGDWAVLLQGKATWQSYPWQPEEAAVTYERLRIQEAYESIMAVPRLPEGLPLGREQRTSPESLSADSVWVLRWSGFEEGTDWQAWRELIQGSPTAFQLISGNGLYRGRDGSVRPIGNPGVVRRFEGRLVVGDQPWAEGLAERLASMPGAQADPLAALDDLYSPWAARLAPAMIRLIERQPVTSPQLTEALAYLRNWNYTFGRASIAASIFDRWMAALSRHTRRPPSLADTLATQTVRLALEGALTTLTSTAGSDLSQWRWETVQPDIRTYPPWTGDGTSPEGPRFFLPLRRPGEGHPTSLRWGGSALLPPPVPTATWEAWTPPDLEQPMVVRRLDLYPHRFLERFLLDAVTPSRLTLSSSPTRSVTWLRPPLRDHE